MCLGRGDNVRTIKTDLPAGVRKKFAIKLGHKVRLVNRANFKKKVKETTDK